MNKLKLTLRLPHDPEKKAWLLSLLAHLLLLVLILIFSYHSVKIFNFGTAAQSPQQVQIVNAVLVMKTPSTSKIISPTPPAPAPPTPPIKNPSPLPHPDPKKPTPSPAKTTPEKIMPDKTAEIAQKKSPPTPPHSQSSLQNQKALQKLKALGLSSLQQDVKSNQKEAASAAQASKNLSLQEKYMGLIQQSIRSNWINQFPEATYTTTLKISLDQKGNVLSVQVSQGSGNAAFDRQAILAVRKSSPLPMPPNAAMARDFMNLVLPFSNQT